MWHSRLAVVAAGLVVGAIACGSAGGFERIGSGRYAIECPRPLDCYRDAKALCPYGFESQDPATAATPLKGRSVLVVQCNKPTFCESDARVCRPLGLRCRQSERYEGRRVCAR